MSTGPGQGMRRWWLRLSAIVVGAALTLFAWIQYASADDPSQLSQTPPALSWIVLEDSRGISIWNYELSIDRGGITAPDKFYWATVTDFSWGIYRGGCAIALWFLQWAMSFSWVKTIAAPLLAVESALQQVVDTLGVVPTFLTITAMLAGLLLLTGRYSTALWEVLMACLIAALATGVFAHPVQMVAGDDGAVVQASRLGQEIAAGVATGESAGKSPEQLRKDQTGQLVDTFIRQPTEMINFGQVIDGTKCEGDYDEVLKAGPYGLDDNIRDKVGSCSKPLGEYAANPSASMAIGSLMVTPAACVIFIMALVLAGSVIAAAVWAMFQSVKAIITLITGLLPGGARGSLMLTAAEVLVSLAMIVITSVFLSVFLLVIQAMFGAGNQVAQTFVIVDVLILVGTIVFLRWRKQILAASHRLAQFMSRRPGGAPTRLPERHAGRTLGAAALGYTAGAVRTGLGVAQLRTQQQMARRPAPTGPTYLDGRRQSVIVINGNSTPSASSGPTWVQSPTPASSQSTRTVDPKQLGGDASTPTAGAGGGPLPAGPTAPQLLGGAREPSGPKRIESRTKKVVGALAAAGTHAALATATGGSSAVVAQSAKAAQAARAARRAAVMARMATSSASAQPRPATPLGPVPTTPRRPSPVIIPGEIVADPPTAADTTRTAAPRATPAETQPPTVTRRRPPVSTHPKTASQSAAARPSAARSTAKTGDATSPPRPATQPPQVRKSA